MSTFSGAQGKGALRQHQARKRQEADQRAERRLVARNLAALADQARADAQATVVTGAGVFVDGKKQTR